MFDSELSAYVLRYKRQRQPSECTLKAYTSDLRAFARWRGGHTIVNASPDDILGYLGQLGNLEAAPRTVRRRVAALKSFYRDQVAIGVLGTSPFDDVAMKLPRPKSLPRGLARQDASLLAKQAKLLVTKKTIKEVDRVLAATILLMLSVGLRVGEVVQLRSQDYESHDGALYVQGKGRRERRVFIVDTELREALKRIRTDDGYLPLFRIGRRQWRTDEIRNGLRRMAKQSGLSCHVTPHMLRHTSATLLLENGVDLLFLQRLLGHENVSTTSIYAQVGDLSLRRSLERASLIADLTT